MKPVTPEILEPKVPDIIYQDYFSQKQAASYVQVGLDNFRRFVAKHGIPHANIAGKVIYRRTDLRKAIEEEWQNSATETALRTLSGTKMARNAPKA